MSEELIINGKKCLPIKEVALRTRYTRDYIAKLARDGSIVGVQVGRQWFIDDTSLAKFIETTELEAEVRKRHLSRERRREREVKVEIKNRFDVVVSNPRYGARLGVMRALAVVVCGVLSGYTLYVAPDVLRNTNTLQKAQPLLPFTEQTTTSRESVEHELPVVSAVLERPKFSDTHEVRRFGSDTQGVLLLPAGLEQGPVVTEYFSDPVVVDFQAPGVGTVSIPSAEGFSTTSLSFVTVPVGEVVVDAVAVPSTVVPGATP